VKWDALTRRADARLTLASYAETIETVSAASAIPIEIADAQSAQN
jgi:hypothetical protein